MFTRPTPRYTGADFGNPAQIPSAEFAALRAGDAMVPEMVDVTALTSLDLKPGETIRTRLRAHRAAVALHRLEADRTVLQAALLGHRDTQLHARAAFFMLASASAETLREHPNAVWDAYHLVVEAGWAQTLTDSQFIADEVERANFRNALSRTVVGYARTNHPSEVAAFDRDFAGTLFVHEIVA